MKLAQVLIAFLLAFSLAMPAGAQVVTPPAKQENKMQVPPKTAGDETPTKDDELIIIPGPRLGPVQKAEPTPEQMEAFYRSVWQEVGKRYVDPAKLADWAGWERKFDGKIKNMTELDAALKAMVAHVGDRWTTYISTADMEAAKKQAEMGLLPIGAMLRKDQAGNWRVDGMMYGTPAHLSKLREGDIVKSIARGSEPAQDLSKLSDAEVQLLLSGKVGDKITVNATWDGADHAVELTFAALPEDAVEAGLLPGQIGYIRFPTFMSEEIMGHFVQALGQLYAASKGELAGLVFDLRNNGGGRVDLALALSSLFIERGVITRTTTREDRAITETANKVIPLPKHLEDRMPKQMAGFQRMLLSVPMVILVNGSTASASEITTGALVDNGRAIVMGTHTFGKAVGYNRGRLPNGGILQITTLSYLTPNGTDIGGKGIVPDKVVEQPREAQDDEQLKAAHAHLMEIVKERAAALNSARDQVTSPQAAPAQENSGFRLHAIHVVAGTLLLLVLLTVGGYMVSQLRRR